MNKYPTETELARWADDGGGRRGLDCYAGSQEMTLSVQQAVEQWMEKIDRLGISWQKFYETMLTIPKQGLPPYKFFQLTLEKLQSGGGSVPVSPYPPA